MAYDPGAIDTALAAAVGDDPALVAELRGAFLDGAAQVLATIGAARGEGEWRTACARLRGLAMSFGAMRLAAAADAAAHGAPQDRAALSRLHRIVARL